VVLTLASTPLALTKFLSKASTAGVKTPLLPLVTRVSLALHPPAMVRHLSSHNRVVLVVVDVAVAVWLVKEEKSVGGFILSCAYCTLVVLVENHQKIRSSWRIL